jgi:hypothetical protein
VAVAVEIPADVLAADAAPRTAASGPAARPAATPAEGEAVEDGTRTPGAGLYTEGHAVEEGADAHGDADVGLGVGGCRRSGPQREDGQQRHLDPMERSHDNLP